MHSPFCQINKNESIMYGEKIMKDERNYMMASNLDNHRKPQDIYILTVDCDINYALLDIYINWLTILNTQLTRCSPSLKSLHYFSAKLLKMMSELCNKWLLCNRVFLIWKMFSTDFLDKCSFSWIPFLAWNTLTCLFSSSFLNKERLQNNI